jgi:hypothetical protein
VACVAGATRVETGDSTDAMTRKLALPILLALAAGCSTTPTRTMPRVANAFPAEALITQRAVLTVRGRQYTLNGYLATSATAGQRLVVTGNLGDVLADVLVGPDGTPPTTTKTTPTATITMVQVVLTFCFNEVV